MFECKLCIFLLHVKQCKAVFFTRELLHYRHAHATELDLLAELGNIRGAPVLGAGQRLRHGAVPKLISLVLGWRGCIAHL